MSFALSISPVIFKPAEPAEAVMYALLPLSIFPETDKTPVPLFVIVNKFALSIEPPTNKFAPLFVNVVETPSLIIFPETERSPELLRAVTVPAFALTSPEIERPLDPSFKNVISPSVATFLTNPSTDKPLSAPYEVIVITPLSFLNELALVIWSILTNWENKASPIVNDSILPLWSTPAIIPPLAKTFTPAAWISTVSLEITLPAIVTTPVPWESTNPLKSLYKFGVEIMFPLNFS